MAKTLQSAVETLERDKAQLQDRVHSLEQRLMGTRASEDHAGAPPSGEEAALRSRQRLKKNSRHPACCSPRPPAGGAVLERLREEKEFAEGQVRARTGSGLGVAGSHPRPAPPPQINFLNSVIVDLQRKNEELKVKLKKLALAEFNGNEETDG